MPYKDPDKRREHRRLYCQINREQELARMAEWRANNLERRGASPFGAAKQVWQD